MTIETVSKPLPKIDYKGVRSREKSPLRVALEAMEKDRCLEIRFTPEELTKTSARKRLLNATVMVATISKACKTEPKKTFNVRKADNGFDVFRTA